MDGTGQKATEIEERAEFPADWRDLAAYIVWNGAFATVLAFAVPLFTDALTKPWHKPVAGGLALLWFFAVAACASSKGPPPAIFGPLNWLRRFSHAAFGRNALIERLDRWFPARDGRLGSFTVRVLDWALLLAVLYPTFLPILGWALTSAPVMIGTFELIPEEPRLWPRLATIGVLAMSLFSALTASASQEHSSGFRWLTLVVLIGAIAVAFTAAVASAGTFTGVVALTAAVAFAAAVAFVFAGTFAVVDGRAVAGAVPVAFTAAVASAFASALDIVVVVAVAGVLFLKRLIMQKSPLLGPAYGVYAATLFIALAGVVAFAPWQEADPEFVSLFLFLGVLPLVNGLFDFVSYGTTLSLLRWGTHRRRRIIVSALLDLAAALAIFLVLGCTLIAVVHWMNETAQVEFFPLPDLFAAVASGNIGSYWWVYAMVFSTILPTSLHFLHAFFSTLLLFPAWAAEPLRATVTRAQYHPWPMVWAPLSVTLAVLGWGAGVFLTVWVPVDMMFFDTGLTPEPVQHAVAWYMGVFVWWADLIGAVPRG